MNCQSEEFFRLSQEEKQAIHPDIQTLDEGGYTAVGEEEVRGRTSIKESFDFDGKSARSGLWPSESSMPGFREFAASFHQVRVLNGLPANADSIAELLRRL